MNIGCVYHSIDLDGWMSAAIVKHWFKNFYKTVNSSLEDNVGEVIIEDLDKFPIEVYTLTFIGYNYGDPIPDLSKYDKIIMCDISFPKDEMLKVIDRVGAGNFIWHDHHISAINDVYSLSEVIYIEGLRNVNFAACELTWQYFFPDIELPEIVRLLGLYDSFRHKGTSEEQKVLEFQYGARTYIKNYNDAYEALTIKTTVLISGIKEAGKGIYQYLCTEAKQAYKNRFSVWLVEPHITLMPSTYKFICINKERFNPINFGIDYHSEGYDGACCFHYDGKTNLWRFSLYNDNGEVDCSKIAKQYGGGGHKGAAGFVLSPDDFNRFMATNI